MHQQPIKGLQKQLPCETQWNISRVSRMLNPQEGTPSLVICAGEMVALVWAPTLAIWYRPLVSRSDASAVYPGILMSHLSFISTGISILGSQAKSSRVYTKHHSVEPTIYVFSTKD